MQTLDHINTSIHNYILARRFGFSLIYDVAFFIQKNAKKTNKKFLLYNWKSHFWSQNNFNFLLAFSSECCLHRLDIYFYEKYQIKNNLSEIQLFVYFDWLFSKQHLNLSNIWGMFSIFPNWILLNFENLRPIKHHWMVLLKEKDIWSTYSLPFFNNFDTNVQAKDFLERFQNWQ